jgi:hypothetical protein
MKNKIFIGVFILSVFGLQSCQKSDSDLSSSTDLTTNLTGAVSEVVSTQVSSLSSADIQSVSVDKFDGSGASKYLGTLSGAVSGIGKGFGKFGIPHLDDCATVTVSSATFPKEIIIDYGTGCASNKKHTKQGQIIITISDTLVNAGAIETIVYKDFYIDSIKVDYSASLKNLGKNEVGNWVIESKAAQTITKNGDVRTQTSEEVTEWVSGFATTDKSDDVYYKSGTGSITVNDSITFSRKITKPILYDKSCEYVLLSGTEELYRKGNTIVIDYGDGECDSIATVTTNGTTEQISLHSNKFKEGGKFEKHCPRGFGERNQGKKND